MDNTTLQRLWQHARALHSAGNLIEASQAYLSILQGSPANAPVLYNLGLVYQELGRLDEARRAYEATVKAKPGLAQAHNNLGNVLQKLNLREEALNSYNRAIELDASLAQAVYNKAVIELALGQVSRAVDSLQRVVELDPANQTAWAQRFAALVGIKRKQAAIDVFVQWQAIGKVTVPMVMAGLLVSRLTGDATLEKRYLAQVEEWPFGIATAEELMPLLGILSYFDIKNENLLACYQRFDAALQPSGKDKVHLLPQRSPGRLRVGYVSADFRRHVMGRILLDVVSAHDRDKVEVFLVSLCEPRYHDAITQQFKQMASGFADISSLDDKLAAQAIAEVDLDILVDLAAVTEAARPGIYTRKPARHIATHLGYHGCVGLRQIEYKFTDRKMEAADSARFQIERPYFLDACFIPLVPVHEADEPSASQTINRRSQIRQQFDLDGKFVFATFVGPIKLSPECLSLWREVLQSVPDSVLAFSPLDAEDRTLLQQIMTNAGIDAARIRFIDAQPSMDESSLRDRYLAVDAVLDTTPYAGGDTTLAALDRNVPVVTLVGDRTPARAGYSILSHLGLTETIAYSRGQYVDIATKLAQDAEWCAALRQKIDALRKSPSGVTVQAHVRELERAYADIAKVDRIATGKLSAREFLGQFQSAVKSHQNISGAEDAAPKRASIEALYVDLLADQPDYVPLLYARGMLAQEAGNAELAMTNFARIVEIDAEHDSARLALATLLAEAGRSSDVITLLAPVAEVTSLTAATNMLLARSYLDAAQYQHAETAAARAVGAAPSDADAAFMCGLVLCHLGRSADALAMFNRTLGAQAGHVEAAYNAAIIIDESGDTQTAEMLFRRVLEIEPRHELAHWRLTALLQREQRADDFVAAAEKFVSACPGSMRARFRHAISRRYAGKLEDETRLLRELADQLLASESPADVEELLRAVLERVACDDVDAELMRQLKKQSDAATALLFGAEKKHFTPRNDPRIRVGYLASGALGAKKTNPLNEICASHDATLFDVFVYWLDRPVPSQSAASDAAQVSNLAGWSVPRIVELINEHDLDIVVDTTALTDEKASALLSQHVAPVSLCVPWNCAHPVKPATYRLCETSAELPVASTVLLAQPIEMPRAIWPISIAALPRDERFSRRAMAVPDDRVIMAVLAPLELLSVRCLFTWKTMLDAEASITLLLVVPNRHAAPAWRRVFQSAGINPSRLMMVDAEASGIRACDLSTIADAVLDTFPASDPASVIDAIRSALPVVTLAGTMPVERAGLSLLFTLGIKDTVVNSGAEYTALARKIVGDVAWREALVRRLKAALIDSPLTDMAGYMRDYEHLLRQLQAHAGEPTATA